MDKPTDSKPVTEGSSPSSPAISLNEQTWTWDTIEKALSCAYQKINSKAVIAKWKTLYGEIPPSGTELQKFVEREFIDKF